MSKTTNRKPKPSVPLSVRVLRLVEWGGKAQGQGSGPMGSGGNGPLVRCCSLCGGIDPTDPRRDEFAQSAHGHQLGCLVAKVLDG